MSLCFFMSYKRGQKKTVIKCCFYCCDTLYTVKPIDSPAFDFRAPHSTHSIHSVHKQNERYKYYEYDRPCTPELTLRCSVGNSGVIRDGNVVHYITADESCLRCMR